MLPQYVKRLSIPTHVSLQLIAACGMGLGLGLISLFVSPVWTLAALIGAGLLLAALKQPEILLLAYLTLTSTVLIVDHALSFSVGFGTVYFTDVVLLLAFGLIAVRALVETDFKIVRTTLDVPLLAFVGAALLSTLIAILQGRVTFNESLGEARTHISYLVFFVVTNLVRTDGQLRRLWRGLALLGGVVAGAMIVQYLAGTSVRILPGRVETLGTEGVDYSGVARIIPPGESLVLATFIILTVLLVMNQFRPRRLLRLLLWGLAGLGVVLTFERHFYVAVGLAVLLLAYLSRGEDKSRLAKWIAVASIPVMGTIVLVTFRPAGSTGGLLNGALDRLGSLANSNTFVSPTSSLRWRDFEYQYALPQIIAHPLIGLGLGAKYRPLVPGRDWSGFDGRAYIHNGHVNVIVKSGLLGYACLAWLFLASLWRGFRYWRSIPDRQLRSVVLGSNLVLLGALIGSIVTPILVVGNWTPVIGILIGINEAVLSRAVRAKQ